MLLFILFSLWHPRCSYCRMGFRSMHYGEHKIQGHLQLWVRWWYITVEIKRSGSRQGDRLTFQLNLLRTGYTEYRQCTIATVPTILRKTVNTRHTVHLVGIRSKFCNIQHIKQLQLISFSDCAVSGPGVPQYTSNQTAIKINHPLMLMVCDNQILRSKMSSNIICINNLI